MRELVSYIGLLRKSLAIDFEFLLIKNFSLLSKLSFLAQKYTILAGLLFKRTGVIKFKKVKFRVSNLSGLGTFQSNIIDFHSEVISTRIISSSNPVIIDVGANVGQFCLVAKIFFPKAQIFSFEPDPTVYEELVHNTNNLPDVKQFNVGLGDKNERRKFYVHSLSLMSSFKKYHGVQYDSSNIKTLNIKTLDSMIQDVKHIDLLKIDVEGFEKQVIAGATKVLSRSDYLIIEIGLGRSTASETNLALLSTISSLNLDARIVKLGRPLGDKAQPFCQDILISLKARLS